MIVAAGSRKRRSLVRLSSSHSTCSSCCAGGSLLPEDLDRMAGESPWGSVFGANVRRLHARATIALRSFDEKHISSLNFCRNIRGEIEVKGIDCSFPHIFRYQILGTCVTKSHLEADF